MLVNDVVENHQPQVGHADIINIREGQGHPQIYLIPIFDDLVVFAPRVPAGLPHPGQYPFQSLFNFCCSL